MEFYRYRNLQACLSQGISFLTDHFWRLLYVALPVAVPFALLLTLLAMQACYGRFFLGETAGVVCCSVVVLLCLVAGSAYTAYIGCLMLRSIEDKPLVGIRFRLVYDGRFRRLGFRSLAVYALEAVGVGLFALVWWVLDGWLLGSQPVFFSWLLAGLLAVVLCILLVPMAQCLQAALLLDEPLGRGLVRGYRLGMAKWGKVFSLSLLTGMVSGVVCALLLSPALVASLAQLGAIQSELAGDAAELPAAFPLLTAGILLVSMLVATLTLWLRVVPQALLFGAMYSVPTPVAGAANG